MTQAATATILPFPAPAPQRQMRHITLVRLNPAETIMATAGFLPGDPGAPWAWICEVVAAECECNEEDVHVLEDETGDVGDLITADGIPVAKCVFGAVGYARDGRSIIR